jgi:hypothetical protein
MDFCQLMVHPVHFVSGEQRSCALVFGHGGLSLGHPLTGWRGQLLGLGLSGGEVHHRDTHHLKGRFMLKRCVLLNRSSGQPTDEPALPWRGP